MYQVTIKGRNLAELKKAVSDINDELNNRTVCGSLEKDLNTEERVWTSEEANVSLPVGVRPPVAPVLLDVADLEDNEIAVESPYAANGELPVVTPIIPIVEDVIRPPMNLNAGGVNPASVELDIEGLPWDVRVHTIKKTKNKNGTWKNKRGADKALVAQVKAELFASVQKAPNPPAVPTLNVAPVVPALTPVIPLTPVVEQAPVAPPQPTMTNVGGHTLETFIANFPMIVGTLISEKKLTPEYVQTLNTYFKVSQIWEITDVQKAEVFESFANFGFITKVG